ncbi:MAG: PAS domain S-box protein [Chloroflexota bacterium]
MLDKNKTKIQLIEELTALRHRVSDLEKDETLQMRDAPSQELVDASAAGIVVHRQGVILYANPACLKIMKIDKMEQIIDRSIFEFIHSDYHQATEKYIANGEKGIIHNELIEEKFVRMDGAVIDVQVVGSIINYQGEPAVRSAFFDITRQKQIKESQKLLENIVNLSPAIAFLWQAAEGWPVEYVSDNVNQLLGYTSEDFYTGAVPFASIVHPDDLARVAAEVAHHSKSGEEKFNQEYRIITKSGKVLWIDDRTLVKRDSNGEITHYQGVILDITGQKRAERAEDEIRQKAEDLTLINSLNTAANQSSSLKEVTHLLLQGFKKAFSGMGVTLFLVSEDKKHLVLEDYILPEAMKKSVQKLVKKKLKVRIPLKPGNIFLEILKGREIQTNDNDHSMINYMIINHIENRALQKLIPDLQKSPDHRFVTNIPLLSENEAIGLVVFSHAESMNAADHSRIDSLIRPLTSVIQRKQTELALKETKESYRQIIEGTSDAIYLTNIPGKFTFVNPKAEILSGYTQEELFKMRFTDLIPPGEWRNKLIKYYSNQFARREHGTSYEFPIITKSGDEKWIEQTVNLLFDGDEITGYQGFVRDISDRKAAEVAFQKSEERYRNIYEHIEDVIYETDFNGCITGISPSVERHSGFKPDQLIGKNVADFYLNPDDYQAMLQAMEAQGSVNDFEINLKKKAGDSIPVSVTAHIVFDDQGQPIKTEGVLRDISERKQVEDEREDALNLLQATIDGIADPIMYIGLDYEIKLANRAVKEQYPQKVKGLCFQISHDLDAPCSGEQHPCPLMVAKETSQPVTMTHQHIRADGEKRTVEIVAGPVLDKSGQLIGIIEAARDITDRVEMTETIRKLSRAVEQSASTIVITDLEGNIEFTNPAFTETTGYTAEEAMGKNPRILKSGLEPPELYVEMWETLLLGNTWRGEIRNKKKNGELYWEWATISPVKTADGRTTHFAAVKDNITARKNVELALIESEGKFRSVFENAVVGMTISTPEGNFLEANQAFCRIVGYTAEELSRMSFWDFTHPDDVSGNRELLKQLFSGEISSYQLEKRYIHKNGHLVWVFLDVVAVSDNQEDTLYCVALIQDITEKKEALKALQESEERFRALVKNAPLGIVSTDPQGNILDVNTAMLEILDSPSLEATKAINTLDFPLLVQAGLSEKLRHCFVTGKNISTELQYTSRWGKTADWSVSMAPVLNDAGGVVLVQAMVEDITERKIVQSEIQQRAAQLEALREMNLEITSQLDLNILLHSVVDKAIEILPGTMGGIHIYHPDRNYLNWVVQTNMPVPLGTKIQPGEGLAGRILETKEPIIVDDYSHWDGRVPELANNIIAASVGAPIQWGDEFLGVIIISSEHTAVFSEKDAELLNLFASQAAIAIRNARLFDQERSARHLAESLQNTMLAVSSTLDFRQVLELILSELQKLVPYDTISVQQLIGDHLEIVAGRGFSNEEEIIGLRFDLESSSFPNKQVMESLQPLILTDSSTHYRGFKTEPHVAANINSWIGVPLLVGEQPLGMIAIDKAEFEFYTEEHAEIAMSFAAQAAIAMKNAQLFDDERLAREEAQTLQAATQAMSSSLNLLDVLNTIISELRTVVPYDSCSVLRLNEDNIEIIAGAGFENWEAINGLSFPLDEKDNPSTLVVNTRQPVIVDDVSAAYVSFQHEDIIPIQIKSWLGVPLLIEGQPLGVIAVDKFEAAFFNESHAQIAASFGAQAAIALKNAQLFADAHHAKENAEESRLEAEKANQAKSIFLANMSHELRTPMNAILGFTQILENDNNLTAHQRENLGIIGRSGDHLLNLISEVLEISKIEAGRMTLSLNHFDLYFLLDTVETMLQQRAGKKGLQLIIDHDIELPQFIYADEGKIRQILINLIGNAIKFTEKGTILLRTKSLDVKTGEIAFEVHDTGLGIEPSEREMLFEPFVQTSSGKKSKVGSGLGLSIAREYARLMGGDIVYSDELETGALFIFTAVVEKSDMSQISTHETRGRVLGLQPGQPVYRILVVEDNPDHRAVLLEILSIAGLETRFAEHGQEGVELSAGWKPDLIFMDIQMPIMDGYEAVKLIKTNQEMPIIALTASAFEHERNAILGSGFDDLVIKPLRTEHILELLERHIAVEFIYEDKENRTPPKPVMLVSLDLQNLPSDLIVRLRQAAIEANRTHIYEIIDEIQLLDSELAKNLSALVDDFRFDKMVELTTDGDVK